jgi:hypothetical protein
MKKKDDEKKLPKFKATTLGPNELSQATGGQMCNATNTRSVCHVDGTDDGD